MTSVRWSGVSSMASLPSQQVRELAFNLTRFQVCLRAADKPFVVFDANWLDQIERNCQRVEEEWRERQ